MYEDKKELAQQYLNEGYQSTKDAMPIMPIGDPCESIKMLLKIENEIRNSKEINISEIKLDTYWLDLIRLLQIHSFFKTDNYEGVKNLQKEMFNPVYNTYIEKKLNKKGKKL